jgi:hypothetical protein
VAARAVDAWAVRLLPSPEASHRPDGQISGFDREVSRLRERALEALVDVLAGASLADNLCKKPDQGRQVVATCFREGGGALAERLRVMERTVGQNPPLWRRYRPLISAIRDLDDPDSDACAGLLHEICFVLTLSGDKSLPWARRT